MQHRQRVNWGFRIGLTLSLILGAAWGFLLGLVLVRVNSQSSILGTIGAAMPVAFAGSFFIGLVFNRLVRAWHKVARLLVALLIVAVGMPVGLVWQLSVQRLDAVQLVNATGASTWNLEWLIAIAGLIGGMWPGWTSPFLRWLGRLPQFFLELIARFFEATGHVFLWAPSHILRAIARLIQNLGYALVAAPSQLLHLIGRSFQNLGQLWPRRIDLPHINMPRTSSLPRGIAPRLKRSRFIRPKATRNHANNDGPRVVAVVEDRCPYCLDVVKRNDPRGVRVCEVCGTPHHADCWAITGKCQVPHLNT